MNNSSSALVSGVRPAGMSWLQSQCRQALLKKLGTLVGTLHLDEQGGSTRIGSGQEPTARIEVKNPAFFVDLATRGSLGAATSWMDGAWESDDLTAVFALFALNPQLTDTIDRGWSRLAAKAAARFHDRRRNSRSGSRQNIADHYDLGNDLFALFLDQGMNYSSAFFSSEEDSLDTAGINKLDRICRKLDLRPSYHVLEVGCGWGGFAIHAATHFGCRVTGLTISQEQYDFATARVAEAGLLDRIDIILCDYRDHEGTYDRVVSIEMIEAVGHEFLGDYFQKIQSFLTPAGAALIQAIAMPDQRYAQYLKGCDFIQRYIFPGSCVPSLGAMTDAVRRRTDLKVVDLEDIAPHYARTLRLWRRRFNDRMSEVLDLGYPERFVRLWNYYFAYCEAGFAERYLADFQILLSRPLWRGSVYRG
jgi:cyclopropane-fatty-acyl-phospholipid synthase